jgi:predicted transcriptional regulator
MKRTTISLPDDVSDALVREAHRRRVPVSQVAREAIESTLGLDDERPRDLSFIGIADSEGGRSNFAEHFDQWLAENWVRDLEADADPGDR